MKAVVYRGAEVRRHLHSRRISLARVMCDPCGTPTGVQRLGVILTPRAPFELNAQTGGGVEDACVTSLAARGRYVMIYTALGPTGPRLAAAVSRDLVHWHRKGLVKFARLHGLDLVAVDNKDGLLCPEPVSAPDGRPALALIHRPTFKTPPPGVREPRPSIGPQDWGQHPTGPHP